MMIRDRYSHLKTNPLVKAKRLERQAQARSVRQCHLSHPFAKCQIQPTDSP